MLHLFNVERQLLSYRVVANTVVIIGHIQHREIDYDSKAQETNSTKEINVGGGNRGRTDSKAVDSRSAATERNDLFVNL